MTVFADELNIPTGVLPYGNGCIAFSIPNLWFLADTDGDDRCDQRKILFGPLGWERDTHGMVSSLRLGPEDWIYATHGFSNTSHFQVRPENLPSPGTVADRNASTLDLTSGSVFRFRPDGSAIELWSSGQVNPFGLCWDGPNRAGQTNHPDPLLPLPAKSCRMIPCFPAPAVWPRRRKRTPTLKHALRLTLADLLRRPGAFPSWPIRETAGPASTARLIAETALAVKSSESAV